MTTSNTANVELRIVALDPPFTDGDGVLFGMQCRAVVEDALPASATSRFDVHIGVSRHSDGSTDFAGPYVHGKKGDRFLYLSWGIADAPEPFVMFARAKIKLAHIPIELLDGAQTPGAGLVCELNATNDSGQPTSGSIQPAQLSWFSRTQ